jgi:hypothetical protein
MDVRFHWLRCHEAQNQFHFFWRPGKTNLADYWTKHRCTAHHIEQCKQILTPQSIITALRESKQRNPTPLQNYNFAAAAA